MLPKKLTSKSIIDVIFTSSLLYPKEVRSSQRNLKQLGQSYLGTKLLPPIQGEFKLSYIAGSERERLRIFRRAIRDADWILPASGGTGCVDILRHLNRSDLGLIKKRQSIFSGFSDATALANFIYFKTKLSTFVFPNADGLFDSTFAQLFFEVLSGTRETVSFFEPSFHWLTQARPSAPIEGIAIGGNFSTFRDLLDVCDIRPRSWEPYILFIEEVDADIEDLHRIIISLEARGVFKHIVALVVGRMSDRQHAKSIRQLVFGTGTKPPREVPEMKNVFEYLIGEMISDRIEQHDPLYILKIDTLGHFGQTSRPKNMFIPIGAKTRIYPDGHIEFIGPFVEDPTVQSKSTV